MSQTMTNENDAPTGSADRPASVLRRGPRRWKALAVAACGVAAATVLGVTLVPGSGSSAEAAVLSAARGTAAFSTVRITEVLTTSHEGTASAAALVKGSDYVVKRKGAGTVTKLGAYEYVENEKGTRVVKIKQRADNALAPFGQSTEKVLTSVLDHGDVHKIGSEKVHGVRATHYRIALNNHSRAALTRLGAGRLAWFEIEEPKEISTINVWVADNRVQRLDEVGPQRHSTMEFFDYGKPVTITAPKVKN